MSRSKPVSAQTRRNWLVDLAVFVGAAIASLSGIYFLYLPSGGYQGGRNPLYGVTILFSRHTWEDLHTWGGVAMIAAIVIHLAIHWEWVTGMVRRMAKAAAGRGVRMSRRGIANVAINAVVGVSFLITAISGLYFLFFATASGPVGPVILFGKTTWDLIHTWAGIVLIGAAVVHFAIHWLWVTKVTRSLAGQVAGSLARLGGGAASRPADLQTG